MPITSSRPSRRAVLAGLGALAAPGLSRAQGAPQDSALRVIATFSILADFVRQVGGERVTVTSIVGPDGNAHAYTPTAGDARAFAQAKLIVLNGLGFEGWMDRMADSSGTKAPRVVASAGVKPLTQSQSHDHSGDVDPHAWQSVANARTYVANIRAGLMKADAAGADDYAANAARYDARLAALDAEIRERLGAINSERKCVITSHAAFGYFAAAYGVKFLAPQGLSSDAEPSASAIGRLITQIRESKASALFVENISDPRLIERIAKETGVKVGGTLYSDALTPPAGPAPTYERMMQYNLEQLVKGLSA